MTIKHFSFLVLSILLPTGMLLAQMLNPAIDRNDEPFCYYSKPTDVIGVMDGRWGTLVTPEGYLYTGYGELMFFTGNPPEPVNQRVKTLMKDYLPIVEYRFTKENVEYRFRMFGATLDGNPESPLIDFIRVTAKNLSHAQRTAYVSIGNRYRNEENTDWGTGDNRFSRPAQAKVFGEYEQAGADFSAEWEYGLMDDGVLRDGKILYLFPATPKPDFRWMLKTGYNEKPDVNMSKLYVSPETPIGVATYALPLKPNGEVSLDFKMPYVPLTKDTSIVPQLRAASFDDYLNRTVKFWDDLLAKGIDISVPEQKVVNTFKTNLIYDLIARNKVDSFYIQKVNDFQYHNFWLRDAAWIVRMYDLSGYHDIAKQCLEFFPRWQQPDGNYLSQGGQYDGWGQTMWAFGEHYRITHDRAFAEQLYPSIQRAVAWLTKARASDPLRIMPVTTPGDNEQTEGHITGHNFIALGGLKNAIAVAEGLGHADDAAAWKKEYDDYFTALLTVLRRVTATTGGYIPPGLDTLAGYDWGNMESVYPEIILDPQDPMVTATLKATRAKYQEGIMTYAYGRYLHHYLTLANTETEVIRGEQQNVIDEMYAMLVHTSATHAGFEFAIQPWGTRDFMMNLAPHGWFSAKYRGLLRNMLVREQGDELHLLSCLSPEWMKEGKSVAVRRAPTEFGSVDFDLNFKNGGATLNLNTNFSQPPKDMVIHLPWFMNIQTVKADGKAVAVSNAAAVVPPGTKTVTFAWGKKGKAPAMSYENAVRDYKKEYRKRYEEFLQKGSQ